MMKELRTSYIVSIQTVRIPYFLVSSLRAVNGHLSSAVPFLSAAYARQRQRHHYIECQLSIDVL